MQTGCGWVSLVGGGDLYGTGVGIGIGIVEINHRGVCSWCLSSDDTAIIPFKKKKKKSSREEDIHNPSSKKGINP